MEHLPEREPQPDVLRLGIERGQEVIDRRLGPVGANQQLADAAVRFGRLRADLERSLERLDRAVDVLQLGLEPRHLNVGVVAARDQLQEPLPGRDGALDLAELAVVGGQRLQGDPIARFDTEQLLVLGRCLAQCVLGGNPDL